MKTSNTNILLLVSLILAFEFLILCNGQGTLLSKTFYKKSCPKALDIIKNVTSSKVAANSALGAKLLRLHFHDCFVRGCDASVLLDPVGTGQTEKQSIVNTFLSGYDVIDNIKTAVEKVCPDVVSCADILALAARDSVSVPFGKPMWDVLLGRRDGNVSLLTDTFVQLPAPFSNFTSLKTLFASKKLNLNDLVTLSGGHTIGVSHCGSFSNRLSNFSSTSNTDPSLDPAYANLLRTECPTNSNPEVEMDPQSSLSFDNHYYKILFEKKGLFQSDAALLTNRDATTIAQKFTNNKKFFEEFGKSMQKMGAIEVLVGKVGEIRKQCRVVNSK
ncbi:hypothetical protein GIB67_039025 [Kingdonia uniflora]|uniref:Peroxidase n=1 Tax=Kingdonia uniflora TaxID=39325 RepID=A0A7J7LL08_9MAGN|nr:hypothetical protein GIB67_039025 [Kingdonia uniflora]